MEIVPGDTKPNEQNLFVLPIAIFFYTNSER